MKGLTIVPILVALLFAACSTATKTSGTPDLDEAKAKVAIQRFLSQHPHADIQSMRVLSAGPIIVDGNSRHVPFAASASYASEVQGHATFGYAQDGKWYLTEIQPNPISGTWYPASEEVK